MVWINLSCVNKRALVCDLLVPLKQQFLILLVIPAIDFLLLFIFYNYNDHKKECITAVWQGVWFIIALKLKISDVGALPSGLITPQVLVLEDFSPDTQILTSTSPRHCPCLTINLKVFQSVKSWRDSPFIQSSFRPIRFVSLSILQLAPWPLHWQLFF